VVPLAVLNPFLAGAFLTDTFVWGRFPLPLKQAQVLEPENMEHLASAVNLAGSPFCRGGQTQIGAGK